MIRSTKARGRYSFANNRKKLDQELQRCSKKWGLKIYSRVWVWDHLHAVIKIHNRTLYKNWIRELNSAIAKALNVKEFFDLRPFTRIIEWGQAFKKVKDYLELNEMETFGLRARKPPS